MPHWLLEGLLIVVSVALGFLVAQFGEYRSNRELAARALASIHAELQHNLEVLEPYVPLHGDWLQALSQADTATGDGAGIDVWFATRPPLPAEANSSFPFLSRSAWDAATSGGALRYVDYDVTAALSEIYLVQDIATANVNRLAAGALSQAATFDTRSRAATIRLLWLTLADIQSAEALLLERYRRYLRDRSGAGR